MIVSALAMQVVVAAAVDQAVHDDAAARVAASMRGFFRARRGEAVESRAAHRSDPLSQGWRTIGDEELRRRSSYSAPTGYRFHRRASVDLDHDGRADVVEMVERSGQMALRITYGRGGRVVVANAHRGRWTDQGLFAAGADAVMVNFPESGAYFLFQREGKLRIEYAGD
ncbi:hypothetical protein SAQ01S_24340 [Sphingomonas aquatilis NBRC 16722]|uniref:VCBS repeat-containing protein n=1 Tax=Sphingomonas aquatilis TaxID=93063 RepID=A0AAW3TPU8_9SPHN|nr:hypothetical protein [Sphingomonas aquatilis]MBB3875002.1 hypothetical protein [Sphingomonas aquatilis]GEM72668.1 hypothetical protein SAQ01S_24340 [Sphingomonas aquatilis NBRC 16722]